MVDSTHVYFSEIWDLGRRWRTWRCSSLPPHRLLPILQKAVDMLCGVQAWKWPHFWRDWIRVILWESRGAKLEMQPAEPGDLSCCFSIPTMVSQRQRLVREDPVLPFLGNFFKISLLWQLEAAIDFQPKLAIWVVILVWDKPYSFLHILGRGELFNFSMHSCRVPFIWVSYTSRFTGAPTRSRLQSGGCPVPLRCSCHHSAGLNRSKQ